MTVKNPRERTPEYYRDPDPPQNFRTVIKAAIITQIGRSQCRDTAKSLSEKRFVS